MTLAFAADQDIVDAVGNALATTAPTGTNDNTWMVDNTVPTASNSTVGATEDTDYTFSAADFNFADENAGARLESVTIQTLPAPETGTLKLADSNVDAGASVTRAQIDNGTLTYSPSENGHGTAHASFSFRVSDGPHESADAYTMTIDVEPSNDLATGVPIVTAPNVFRVPATLSVDLSAIEDIEGVTRIAESAAYRWKRFDSGGTTVAPNIATGPTYTLAVADVGSRIGVEVTFNDDEGFEESITSEAFPTTGTIRSAAGACPAPTHVGGATQIWSANLGLAEIISLGILKIFGYFTHSSGPPDGSLDNTALNTGTGNYTVQRFSVSETGTAHISLDKDLVPDEKRTLVAHVCDRALLFKTARIVNNRYIWSSTGIDWSDYAHRTVYVSRDTVAPTLSHISVAGTSVVLTFSEALSAASGLANSAFTVKKTVQSVEETLTLSAAPAISGAAVTLTLMSEAVESIDTVTVSYDKPDSGSNNKLADRTDNEVEDFTTTETDAPPHVVSIARQNPSASPTNANSLTWRVTFSKDVSNVDATDFQVSGTTATPTDVSEVTASTVYDVTASGGNLAGLDATVTLMFATGQNIADTDGTALAGTAPTGTNESTWVVDNIAPGVASIERQDPTASPTNANSLTWRVTFDEDVSNVDAMDFEVSGTTATPTAVSEVTASTVYDVTVSGGNLADRNATVTLAFAAGQNIVDTADNALSNTTPTGTNDNDYFVDNAKPTVTITGVPMTSTAAFTATITFLEPVNGFAVGDITVGNGTAAAFTGSEGDTQFTALITPTADGAVTVDVAADVATDAVGNGNTAAAQASSTYTALLMDNTAPRVTSIARQTPASSPTNANSLTWRVTFDEDVENVDAMDFEVSGTTATPTAVSEVTASTVYDVTVSGGNLADLDALVTLAFVAGQDIDDLAGNALASTAPTGANENGFVVDNTAPSVVSIARQTPSSPTNASSLTWRVTFSEDVANVDETDFTVSNTIATLTAAAVAGSSAQYDVTAAGGDLGSLNTLVTLAFVVGQDIDDPVGHALASTAPTGANENGFVVDNTAPRVASIARQTPASSPTNANSLTWRVTFERGRGERGYDGFRGERHDGDADGRQRGNGIDGLRRDGQRGQPGGPQRHGDARVRRGPGHRRYGRQRAFEHHADGGERQRLCRRQRKADGDDHGSSDDEHGRLHGDDHLPGAGERVRGG